MTQLTRLISILTLLKSKRLLTSTDLVQKFDVSVRTIYRDIKKLQAAGIPINTEEGKGYSLMAGYNIAPVMFDEAEANALITAEKLITKTNDSSLIESFELAMVKIKSIFKSSLQSKSEFLTDKMLVLDKSIDSMYSRSLSAMQLAITNFNLMEIEYRKPTDEKNTLRKIEPVAIYSFENKWIAIAWCHLRNDYRAFRLDRIKNYKVITQTFKDRKFDLRNYFLSCPEFSIEN